MKKSTHSRPTLPKNYTHRMEWKGFGNDDVGHGPVDGAITLFLRVYKRVSYVRTGQGLQETVV